MANDTVDVKGKIRTSVFVSERTGDVIIRLTGTNNSRQISMSVPMSHAKVDEFIESLARARALGVEINKKNAEKARVTVESPNKVIELAAYKKRRWEREEQDQQE